MKNHWADIEERGIVWGMNLLLKIHLIFGRKVLQFFLYPVVSYYWLSNRKARASSREYLERISHYVDQPDINNGLKCGYQHFISFANALIDKLAAWCGSFTLNVIEFYGREPIINHIDQGQGVLILGSHLGNLEVCRVIAQLRNKVTINVLVHTKHTEKFNKLLNQYATSGRLNLIQVSGINAATAMLLQDKIEAGELGIIAADRTPISGQGARTSQTEFLGKMAHFPQGPFILALLLKCPVYTLFCLKQKDKQIIYFDHFSEGRTVPRKERAVVIQQWVEDYAARLQNYCLKAPLQWFNFYDFWQTEE
jgi:predicted LPLAT superfamily acyltransferase